MRRRTYFNKNANLVLLFTIISMVTVLVATTTYFAVTFDSMYTQMEHLENKVDDVNEYQEVLHSTRNRLTTQQLRESQFYEFYEEKDEQIAALEEDKVELADEIISFEEVPVVHLEFKVVGFSFR